MTIHILHYYHELEIKNFIFTTFIKIIYDIYSDKNSGKTHQEFTSESEIRNEDRMGSARNGESQKKLATSRS